MKIPVEEAIKLLGEEDADKRLQGALACYDSPPIEMQDPLVKTLAQEDDVKVRATLLKALARIGDKAAVPVILEYFDDPDNRVRANAVEALGSYRDPQLIKHFKMMFNDPHNRVRGNAMLALAHFAEREFKNSLRKMTRSTLPSTCLTALYVLSKLEEPWAISLLGRMALRPDNPVRTQTFKVLDMLARKEVPGAFPALYTARRSATVRIDPEKLTMLQPPKVTRKNMRKLLEDKTPRVRIYAIQEAAQRMDAREVLDALYERIHEEANEHVLATMVKWIGVIASDSGIELLEPYLSHEDGRVRANTLEGLGHVTSQQVYRLAMTKINDPVPRVRAMAAKVIARHDPHEAFAILKSLILSDKEKDTAAALHAIDVLEGGEAVELLEHILLHGGESSRAKVLNVLKLIEDRVPMARRLRERFEEGSFAVYEDKYINSQIERLDSSDDAVRLDALNRLRFCRSTKAWDTIEELAANDRSVKVRELASRFVEACNVERSRRIHYHSFGLRVKQLYELGMVWNDKLLELCEQLAFLSSELNDDNEEAPLERLLMERRDTLILLGERGWECLKRGQLKDETLWRLDEVLQSLGKEEDERGSAPEVS